jgi:hypothetical protein
MCQPGKPTLQGAFQRIICSGEAFFQSAKSTLRRFSLCPSSARVFNIIPFFGEDWEEKKIKEFMKEDEKQKDKFQ